MNIDFSHPQDVRFSGSYVFISLKAIYAAAIVVGILPLLYVIYLLIRNVDKSFYHNRQKELSSSHVTWLLQYRRPLPQPPNRGLIQRMKTAVLGEYSMKILYVWWCHQVRGLYGMICREMNTFPSAQGYWLPGVCPCWWPSMPSLSQSISRKLHQQLLFKPALHSDSFWWVRHQPLCCDI